MEVLQHQLSTQKSLLADKEAQLKKASAFEQ